MPFRFIADGLRRLFHGDVADRELQDEIDHYLELSARENVRRGMSPADAERAARMQFGGVEAVKDHLRASGWESAVDTLWRDVRYAARGMRRDPGFTAVACITLALGVGATTAMFSVVSAVVLRPLPYHDARRLVQIWTDDRGRGLHREHTASRTIADWRDANHTLTDVAFYSAGRATIGEGTSRERTRGAFVSGNLFPVLGVVPLRGRALSPADERDAADVVVISHSLWQRRFGGDSTIVGKSIYMEDAGNGTTGFFRIIGVMPAGFYFPDRQTELWRPATTYSRFQRESVERFADWARRWVAVARLKPGVTLDDARSDLATLGRRLAESHASDRPDFPGFVTNVEPMLDGVAGRNLTNEDAETKIRALWSAAVAGQSLAQRQRTAPAEPVVVNEAFARRFFPNEDPIGKRFCIDPTNKAYWYEIVGVVGDMHRQGLDRRAVPEYFGPLIPMPSARSDLLVRTSGDPMAMVPTIREMVLSTFPGGLVNGVSTAEHQLGDFNAGRNLQAWLFTTFALLALSLAAVGIYGVVQFGVAERTREIGVRIALGAAAPEVVRMIVGQGMRAPILGLTIGVVTALALTRLIAGLLFGTSPADPVTFTVVTLVLSAVALSACLIPARRAASLSPAAALRHD